MNVRPDGSVRENDCPTCGGLGSIIIGTDHLGTRGGGDEWATCGTCQGSGTTDPPILIPLSDKEGEQ